MKTKLQSFCILLALFAGIHQAAAQTNVYLFTGYETNITLPAGTYIITAYGAQGGNGYSTFYGTPIGGTGGLGWR